MGYCTEAEARAFLKQAPVFEKMLVDDGILLFKYWLTVDQARQEERFAERLADPLKRWKLSPSTCRRARSTPIHRARDAMLGGHPHAATRPGRWWTSTTSARPPQPDPPPARPCARQIRLLVIGLYLRICIRG
jgi:polyphosphate kinase 2 (PPK2 family)